MEGVLALLGAAGIVLAIAANVTTIAAFLEHRRRRRAAGQRHHREAAPDPAPAAAPPPAAPLLAAPPPAAPPLAASPAAPTPVAPPPVALRTTAVPAPPRAAQLIRTPDQRVRVFVSSTLHELAEERLAARVAVERLRLTPVLFELGARPHPPRDLYRAYLDQSDVFVAIYGHRYGWVAPGEEVSGLEDEWLLSGERPKLVYLKRQEGPREPRLEALLERIRAQDHVSYRSFGDARELGELLADDLATLLSERFVGPAQAAGAAFAAVPAAASPLVGRDDEVARACALLQDPAVRLVTLYGPGGIGKSRLALEVAQRVRTAGPASGAACSGVAPDGVVFVGLESVRDERQLAESIARALGVGEAGPDPIDALVRVLAPLELLLVLDNFEQLLEAGPLLATLLEAAPGVTMLVTSRARLRISAERAVALTPLPLPQAPRPDDDAVRLAETNPSVQLFVWRARAVAELRVDERTAPVLIDIVRRLDGWPLALVLAASRVSHMSLTQLRDRLARRLDVLVGGDRDLPERQKTLRRTIDWSLEILSEDARRLLAWLGAFAGGATLEALEAVADAVGRDAPLERDPVDALAELVDHSLVVRVDAGSRARYAMLETIREAAVELLAASPDEAAVRDAHARTFAELAFDAGPSVFHDQDHGYTLLVEEEGNLRVAVRRLEERGDVSTLARLAGSMWLFWGMRGQHDEQLPWIVRALGREAEVSSPERMQLLLAAAALAIQVGDYARGERWMHEGLALLPHHPDGRLETTMCLGRAIVAVKHGRLDEATEAAEAARQLAVRHGSAWAEGFADVTLARIAIATGRLTDALAHAQAALHQMVANGDRQSEGWARTSAALVLSLLGRHDEALADARDALLLFSRLGYHQATVNALRTAAFVYARSGETERATRLAGAAAVGRDHYGMTSFEPETSIIDAELERLRLVGADRVSLEWDDGREMPLDVAVRYALSEPAPAPAG